MDISPKKYAMPIVEISERCVMTNARVNTQYMMFAKTMTRMKGVQFDFKKRKHAAEYKQQHRDTVERMFNTV